MKRINQYFSLEWYNAVGTETSFVLRLWCVINYISSFDDYTHYRSSKTSSSIQGSHFQLITLTANYKEKSKVNYTSCVGSFA